MKKFYLVMFDGAPKRIFTEKVDLENWLKSMAGFGYTDYVVIEVEGFQYERCEVRPSTKV